MYNKEKQEQKADDKNFENIVLKTKDNYWFASRFSDCNTDYVRFGLMFANDSGEIRGHGLYHSTNVDYGSYAGIRPVCTLEKDVLFIYN